MGEFKPTIFFLLKFVGFYLVANLAYGFFVTTFAPRPDPMTHEVTQHAGFVLSFCGWDVTVQDDRQKPNTLIVFEEEAVISVYEGCNGINTIIVFVAFLFALGPLSKPLLWFIPLGILIIHLANLARISLLFYVARYHPENLYFVHKYFFTAILYGVIFGLWIWWVKSYSLKK